MTEIAQNLLLEVGVAAARAGGKVLQDWATKFSVREKSCAADVVTEADFESQKVIHSLICKAFPSHGFLGEEGLNQPSVDSPYRWIVDPLDGTSNYVHGFPYYAVSIGVERQGELVAGIVYDPTRDEMFTATKGEGAWCNGRRLHVSNVSIMKQALIVASFPPGSNLETPSVQHFLQILPRAQTVQRTGSAAMNLANLAAGRVDGFWSWSLKPWDMAGGALLVTEAGGKITKTGGTYLQIEVSDMLATNGSDLHGELVQTLS